MSLGYRPAHCLWGARTRISQSNEKSQIKANLGTTPFLLGKRRGGHSGSFREEGEPFSGVLLGVLVHCFLLLEEVYWFLGFLVFGVLVVGFLVSEFLGFKVSWFLGFEVSKLQRFTKFQFPQFRFFLEDIAPIFKIF